LLETAVPNWQTGETLIAAGNVRYRVLSVIPAELVAEFIDGPDDVGIIEVEPLQERGDACRVGALAEAVSRRK
jgi:hypothetical protein